MQSENLKLEEIVGWTGGKKLGTKKDSFNFIGTDSRDDLTGKLFIPLRGDMFDAHDFIKSAIDKGATGVLVDRKSKKPVSAEVYSSITAIEVDDTLLALQKIAHGYRKKLNKKMDIKMKKLNNLHLLKYVLVVVVLVVV